MMDYQAQYKIKGLILAKRQAALVKSLIVKMKPVIQISVYLCLLQLETRYNIQRSRKSTLYSVMSVMCSYVEYQRSLSAHGEGHNIIR